MTFTRVHALLRAIAALTLGIDLRFTVASFIQLAGIVAFIWGFFLIAPFIGFIVGGIALMVIGRAIDPPRPTEPKHEEAW